MLPSDFMVSKVRSAIWAKEENMQMQICVCIIYISSNIFRLSTEISDSKKIIQIMIFMF